MPLNTFPEKLFHPLVTEWFRSKYGNPTDIQASAWPLIAEGKHVLITAPTGSGKTLAAFLWGIDMLASGKWETGSTRLLYISPLKALNNDVRENLIIPLEELAALFESRGVLFPRINALTRSGDTPNKVRVKMMKIPPEILITTPESLNILLNTERSHALFGSVRTVIMDEIHALMPNKRGTHMISAIERLTLEAGEFQRIALSATIKPIERAAAFAGGYTTGNKGSYVARDVSIIRSSIEKRISVRVLSCEKDEGESIFLPLVDSVKARIKANRSTLVFTNARTMCEKITRLINENEPEILAYSHHGSLSKELRLHVEKMLRSGKLKSIVATSSLELGIDIGDLDEVILVETPQSVSAGLQRVGRAGHAVGQTSRGVIFPLHGLDFLRAAILAKAVQDRDIEETHPIENPLDVLAQVLLAMILRRPWNADELYAWIRRIHSYNTLTRTQYDLVIGMLAGKYGDVPIGELKPRVLVDSSSGMVKPLSGVKPLLLLSGGTIADRGYFELRTESGNIKIGELDEEFVWERRVGNIFNFGTQDWQITKIDSKTVEVRQISKAGFSIPFWKGDRPGKDFHLAEKEGLFLEEADSILDDPGLRNRLETEFFMDAMAADNLLHLLERQKRASGGVLSHRHRIVLEHVKGQGDDREPFVIVIHTLWGIKVNRPFSLALQGAWEEKYGYMPDTFVDDNAIRVAIPHECTGVELVSLLSPETCEKRVLSKLPGTGFFGARFRENAGRALILPRKAFGKRTPFWLTRLRARKLYEAVSGLENFPIVLETYRACMRDDLDITNLIRLLEEIQDGIIEVKDVYVDHPTPFARGSAWRETNVYMYQGDEPRTSRTPAVREELFAEIAKTEWLRPKIETATNDDFTKKAQRSYPGYSPADADELVSWTGERILIPESEWDELLSGMTENQGMDTKSIIEAIAPRLRLASFPGSSSKFVATVDSLFVIAETFAIDVNDLKPTDIRNVSSTDRQAGVFPIEQTNKGIQDTPGFSGERKRRAVLLQWLRFYGIIKLTFVEGLFGTCTRDVMETYGGKEAGLSVVSGTLSSNSHSPEICAKENFERLLRIKRKKSRLSISPLPKEYLQLFLATWQGLTSKKEGADGLRSSLESLFGIPLHAELWETEVFPARILGYRKSMLDSLCSEENLVWFGYGKGKLGFAIEEELELFPDKPTSEEQPPFFPREHGRYSFWDLAQYSGLESRELTEKLWEYVWEGIVSNSSFETIRKGLENDFKPVVIQREPREAGRPAHRQPGMARWRSSRPIAGLWYVLERGYESADEISKERMRKDRARQLFARYGVFSRGLHEYELPAFSWKNLSRTMQVMELGGEIFTGLFFEGVPGPQFMGKEALGLLSGGLDDKAIYMMNACDPASLCGSGFGVISANLPSRIPSTRIVYEGTKPVIVSKRNHSELEISVRPDHERLDRFVDFITQSLDRDYAPQKAIKVEIINGERADKSEYGEAFEALGFSKDFGAFHKHGSY